jgi:glutathione S-transferase
MAYEICPERMVPSLKDKDRETGERMNVFDGTVCLQYLADQSDVHGERSGYTAAERGAVFTWVAYQTVGME